jgi:hypothetical protein
MTRAWLAVAALGVGVGAACSTGLAQDEKEATKTGYVTEVHGAREFVLNGQTVVTDSSTLCRLAGTKEGDNDPRLLQHAERIGVYLEVHGNRDPRSHVLHASQVLVRNDWDKTLDGFGVIVKVSAEGDGLILGADGYTIRITSATQLSYGDGLKAAPDAKLKINPEIKPNQWVRYKGVRDAEGVVVASEAKIVAAKFSRLIGPYSFAKGEPEQAPVPSEGALLDINGRLVSPKAKVRYNQAGGECGWHRVPSDAALQDRVARVGMRVVPAYQKELSKDDPAKIRFRFYAVEEEKVRSEMFCVPGLILIPRQVVERLENDDQLAALLADGVAFNLQLQSTRLRNQELAISAAELAASLIPMPVGIAAYSGGIIASHAVEKRLEEQRARMALMFMENGAFDPWQAPEAWRLLAGRTKNGSTGPVYQDRSGYQLEILNLQYAETRPSSVPSAQ